MTGNRSNTAGSWPGMMRLSLAAMVRMRSCAARLEAASNVCEMGTWRSRFSYTCKMLSDARTNRARSGLDADVLRLERVLAAGVHTDAGDDLLIVAVHETHAAGLLQPEQHRRVVGGDHAIKHSPVLTDVMLVLVLLNPDARLRKQVEAVRVVPVGVADDDVGDLVSLDAQTGFHGVGRLRVRRRMVLLHEPIAIEARVDQDVAAAAADHPHRHGDVELSRRVRVGDEITNSEWNRRVTDRVPLIARAGRRSRLRRPALSNDHSPPATNARLRNLRIYQFFAGSGTT